MSEQTGLMEKPRKLWNGALKMVRGENNAQLVEQFTAEMTLVAEGLCEDQAKLHQDVERMMTEEDRRIQKLEARIDLLEQTLEEERNEHDRNLTETRNRLAALEKKAEQASHQIQEREKERAKEIEKEKNRKGSMIRGLTVLVGIAGGSWVLVTLLNLIRAAIGQG